MEILLNPDGTRNRDYRPYIDQEELHRNVGLYKPYESPKFGLYDSARPYCSMWLPYFQRHQPKVPFSTITANGRIYRGVNPTDHLNV